MDTPAGNASGPSAAPGRDERARGGEADGAANDTIELPSKLRVHALAKLLGASSREVIRQLDELGEQVRSAQSNINREVALQVVQAMRPEQLEVAEDARSEQAADEVTDDSVEATAAAVSEPSGNNRATGQEPSAGSAAAPAFAAPQAMFLAPEPAAPTQRQKPAPADEADTDTDTGGGGDDDTAAAAVDEDAEDAEDDDGDAGGRRRRRRGRRGRGRGRGADGEPQTASTTSDDQDSAGEADEAPSAPEKPSKGSRKDKKDRKGKTGDSQKGAKAAQQEAGDNGPGASDGGAAAESAEESDDAATNRRRRRRRRKGSSETDGNTRDDDPPNTVVHVRESAPEGPRQDSSDDEVRAIKGSTRLEAKRQRRRDGREAGRRRAPVLSESEFLARRESVDRRMVVREGEQTQVAVLEDNVLVENFVTSAGSGSLVGNVYLGRVQNVLPSMEAAFVDIGRGRNAVLYAGEVDWDAAGLAGKARRIEQALSTGDSVLVQVTKDPMGHKGARLTTQISLPGRFLVYVPGGGATGISRKLPDNERKRLKEILKRIVPENSGVIIRTASEGTSEEALERDVRRLQAQWEVIKEKSETPKAQAPQLLYEEPDLLIKVVRDLFTEDFSSLTVQGNDAWETIEAYVHHVAPDLVSRLTKHVGTDDVFTEQRIDEQIAKALDRKVWLPSGGYLVIDRTEAMTVIDVNTGKFTGSGGNLEETVTRNNLEAAEEIVRQLRLRDIGGIIVIDFIDMVLESNRDLVLRRLTECLGRDRTRHQVAEVTSLGLVQMTRKRVGTGLLEAYSSTCEHCRGRGLTVSTEPIDHSHHGGQQSGGNGGSRRNRQRSKGGQQDGPSASDKQASDKQGSSEKQAEKQADKQGSSEKAAAERSGAPAKGSSEKPSGDKTRPDKQASDKQASDKPASDKQRGAKQSGEKPTPADDRAGAKQAQPHRHTSREGDAEAPEPAPAAASGAAGASTARGEGDRSGDGDGRTQAADRAAMQPPEQVADSPNLAGGPVASQATAAGSVEPGRGQPDEGVATDAKPKRRKVTRPTSSAGTAREPIVVSPETAEGSDAGVPAPPTNSTAVSSGVSRRSSRRAAGRAAGPPVELPEDR